MGRPTIYPTGTTIYDPEKAWNGYTLFPIDDIGAILIDMNGRVVKVWKDFQGFPNKLLPGGYVLGSLGARDSAFSYQDQTDVTQLDWDGNVVWKFDHKEYIEDEGKEPMWMARQHHDYQREGNPVGYYVPGMESKTDGGNTLITEGCFCRLFEVTPEKEIVWEYRAPFDHLSRSPYIYRAYRYPYDYVPQLEKPVETPVERVDCMTFRMPGAAEGMLENITTVPEALSYTSEMAACVTEDDDENAGDLF